jgi:hypothetical protein
MRYVLRLARVRTQRVVSSMVEQAPFKHLVAGSSPARPTLTVSSSRRQRLLILPRDRGISDSCLLKFCHNLFNRRRGGRLFRRSRLKRNEMDQPSARPCAFWIIGQRANHRVEGKWRRTSVDVCPLGRQYHRRNLGQQSGLAPIRLRKNFQSVHRSRFVFRAGLIGLQLNAPRHKSLRPVVKPRPRSKSDRDDKTHHNC